MIAKVVFLALLACGDARQQSSTELRAQSWLRQHANPDEAGLNDLKASDPSAFAVIQALLVKQQMGLLDASHPSASFAHTSSAADILRAAPTINAASVTVEAPEAVPVAAVSYSEPVHHQTGNFLNWKPSNNDDALVSSVQSGSVPSVQGSGSLLSQEVTAERSAPEPRLTSAEALSWSNAANMHAQEAMQAQAPEQPQAEASMITEKAYVKRHSLGIEYAPQAMQELKQGKENSYLASINFGTSIGALGSSPKSALQVSGDNSLTSFSFDAPATPEEIAYTQRARTEYIQKLDAKTQPVMSQGSLGSWLGKASFRHDE